MCGATSMHATGFLCWYTFDVLQFQACNLSFVQACKILFPRHLIVANVGSIDCIGLVLKNTFLLNLPILRSQATPREVNKLGFAGPLAGGQWRMTLGKCAVWKTDFEFEL